MRRIVCIALNIIFKDRSIDNPVKSINTLFEYIVAISYKGILIAPKVVPHVQYYGVTKEDCLFLMNTIPYPKPINSLIPYVFNKEKPLMCYNDYKECSLSNAEKMEFWNNLYDQTGYKQENIMETIPTELIPVSMYRIKKKYYDVRFYYEC